MVSSSRVTLGGITDAIAPAPNLHASVANTYDLTWVDEYRGSSYIVTKLFPFDKFDFLGYTQYLAQYLQQIRHSHGFLWPVRTTL
jgi:hypothetical protein